MRKTLIAMLAIAASAFAQRSFEQSEWTKPFPAHRIIGPVYYVGTADLACFLITSPEGHILINTGLADSAAQIRTSVEASGFKMKDVKILLTNQAHFDHVAAMAGLKKETGAKMMATEGDKTVLEDGGQSDFFLGAGYRFAPVKVDAVLQDGQAIRIGGVELRTHLTPGHTRGSVSYSMRVRENGRDYNVVFANIPSVIGARLEGNAKYPSIAKDFSRSFRVLRALACDIFLAAHGSQYRMRDKHKTAYHPDTFLDPAGYRSAIDAADARFEEQLKKEKVR